MQPLKFLTILGILLLISGCTKPIEIISEPVHVPIIIQEHPKPVNPYPVTFKVVNENNLEEFLNEIRTIEGEVVFIGFRIKDYENLSLNYQDLIRYVKQQKEIIIYYENVANKTSESEEE
jgi:hypothetical protein|tara:strand:+ start:1490 stop:1849 length:360 start_codon:yes stop_codon:yes gene_type:complete